MYLKRNDVVIVPAFPVVVWWDNSSDVVDVFIAVVKRSLVLSTLKMQVRRKKREKRGGRRGMTKIKIS